jgi:hypothetical protein
MRSNGTIIVLWLNIGGTRLGVMSPVADHQADPLVGQALDELRQKAERFRVEAHGWATAPPAAEESGRLMKLVLQLHVDVAKFEKETGAK